MGSDIFDGISRAMKEGGMLKDAICFCDQLLYADPNDQDQVDRTQIVNDKKLSSNKLGKEGLHVGTRYIMWVVNLTPMQETRHRASGSHWCVLLLDFAIRDDAGNLIELRVDETHTTYPDAHARLHFFDPMGGKLPDHVKREVKRLLESQLIGNLLRINHNYGQVLRDDRPMNPLKVEYIDLRWNVQEDGVQCGIWCIWFAHQLMRTGVLDRTAWSSPPQPTGNVQNQLAFRRWYFETPDATSSRAGPPKTSRATDDESDDAVMEVPASEAVLASAAKRAKRARAPAGKRAKRARDSDDDVMGVSRRASANGRFDGSSSSTAIHLDSSSSEADPADANW
tara:strand:+ start:1806 stop:2822 length:1017 start_codon:yes stop_codon:yes gene_type:complete